MSKFRVGQGVTTSTGGIGVIVDVRHTLPESSYQVFLNGRPQPFYEGQLSAAELETSPETASADALRCRLAALSLTNPSGDSALSVNEGRIDHIPYQYRPVLRLLRADRPRLLIADEVGVGKTIEAGLILRELHARRELRRVLVVCSKALIVEEKWQQEMRRFDEEFTPLDGNVPARPTDGCAESRYPILWRASDEASYATGSVRMVDGGQLAKKDNGRRTKGSP